jgi:hypothetical protein
MTLVRLLAAIAALATIGGAGTGVRLASAGRVSVRIDSTPPGATLYLDSRGSEPIGKTPFKGELAEGTYTLIVELEGYEASVQTIRVKRKGRKPLRFSADLEKIRTATLEVKARAASPTATGGTIVVDGVEQGTVPDRVVVPAGPHQVEVVKDGYKTFEVWVEPAEGDERPVDVVLTPAKGKGGAAGGDGAAKGKGKGKGKGKAGKGKTGDEGEDEGEGEDKDRGDEADAGDEDATAGEDEDADADERDAARARPRDPYVIAGLAFVLGSRSFSYTAPEKSDERPYDAAGVPMARLHAELYPMAKTPNPALRGLGVAFTYTRAAPIDSTTTSMQKIATAWSEFDLAARYAYGFGGEQSLPGRASFGAVEVGYGGQDFDYTVADGGDTTEDELPEVAYRFVRFAADARLGVTDRLAFYGGGSYRQVRGLGALADNYSRTTVASFGAGLGAGWAVTRRIEVRLDGEIVRYALSFAPKGTDNFNATAGADHFFDVGLAGVFRY